MSARETHPTGEKATRSIFLSPRRVSPFLVWGDFHACSTIPEEKWGTTRSLLFKVYLVKS